MPGCTCSQLHNPQPTHNPHIRLLYYVFALSSMVVGALSTHGLGGRLQHGAVLISRGIQSRRRLSSASTTSLTSILPLPSTPRAAELGGDDVDDGDADRADMNKASNYSKHASVTTPTIDTLAASVPDPLEDPTTDAAFHEQLTTKTVSHDVDHVDHNNKHHDATTATTHSHTTLASPPSTTTTKTSPLTTSTSTTSHGLGWSFFQPFRGGTLFIATQGVAWAFFATCLLLFAWAIYAAVLGVAHCVGCWAVATGLTMFVTQVLLGTSLFLFRGGAAATRKVGVVFVGVGGDVGVDVYVGAGVYFVQGYPVASVMQCGAQSHIPPTQLSMYIHPHILLNPTHHNNRQQQQHDIVGCTYGSPSSSSTHPCTCTLH